MFYYVLSFTPPDTFVMFKCSIVPTMVAVIVEFQLNEVNAISIETLCEQVGGKYIQAEKK